MKKLILLLLLSILLTSCITINIYTKPTTIKQYQQNNNLDSLQIESTWY